MTANLPAYIIESDQIGTAKEESLVMLTQLRADCAFPGSLECLSFRALARTSEDLSDYYSSTGGPPCRLYPFSLSSISETLAGKRQGLPAFDFVASYVLSCLRHAAGQCPGRRDQSTTILAYWENIHAAHATDAAADAAKRDARTPALNDAPDSAAYRTAYALPQHQQDFLLTHGPYARILLARAQLGHPHARYRAALLMATNPKFADDATALLIDVASSGHPLALDLLDAVKKEPAPAGADPGVVCPMSQVAARFAWDLGRAAQDHGADEHAYTFFRAAARGGKPEAVSELTLIVLKKTDPEAAEWFGRFRPLAGSCDIRDEAGNPIRLTPNQSGEARADDSDVAATYAPTPR